jgi:hypothetical protein
VARRKRGQLSPLKETLILPSFLPKDADENVEIDEAWTFVRRKKRQVWVWIAISYETRQVLAMVIGDRSHGLP